MEPKLIQHFLQQEAGAFGNNLGKEPQKPCPELKNMYMFTKNICSTHKPMQVAVFYKNGLIM